MTTHILPLVIAFLAAAAIGGFFFVRLSGKMKSKLKVLGMLSQFTPGKASCRRLTPGFRGTMDGMPFAVELPRDSSNSGIGLELSVTASTLFQLEMHRGIDVSDPGAGHGQLDFDIIDDPNMMAPTYLNDAVRRQYIWNFLTTGFSSFAVEKDKVRIVMHNCDIDADLQPAAVYIQIIALVQLAKDTTRRPTASQAA